MLTSIFQQTSIPVLQEVVEFAQSRHAVLAGNIANLDTPGYKVRDLSPDVFRERLQEAIAAKNSPSTYYSEGLGKTVGNTRDAELAQVSERSKTILFHDGSDVGLEQQVLNLSNNQFMHNMAIALMRSQFSMLQTAISERV